MRKIVLLANADSLWTKEYVENVLVNDFEIFIISEFNGKYSKFYLERGVQVFEVGTYPSNRNIIKKRFFKSKIDKISKIIDNADIFHVHYVNFDTISKTEQVWNICNKHILTFWGSDLYRVNSKENEKLIPYFEKADKISFMTDDMKETFNRRNGTYLVNKEEVIDFGNPMYKMIDSVSEEMSREKAKEYWNIDSSRFTVVVGYNGRKEQQHLQVIQQIVNINPEIRKKITIILHFGYGKRNKKYEESLKKLLVFNGIEYVLIDKFLEKREIAILRVAADMMINAQTTDAFSGSVSEYLYAGCILVNGEWLNYEEVRKRGISYFSFKSFEQIPSVIENAYNAGKKSITQIKETRQKLCEINSWEKVETLWKKMYIDLYE